MSLRGRCSSARSNLLYLEEIASSQRTSALLAMTCLQRLQILLYQRVCDGALSHRGGDAVTRSITHIACRENSRRGGFQKKRIPFKGPVWRRHFILHQIGSREHVSLVASHHQIRNQLTLREHADEHEQRRSVACLRFIRLRVFDDDLFERVTPIHFEQIGIGENFDLRVALHRVHEMFRRGGFARAK